MNLPGSDSGNWNWRFHWGMVDETVAPTLARIAAVTGRAPFAVMRDTGTAASAGLTATHERPGRSAARH
jgi:hypothetical protein